MLNPIGQALSLLLQLSFNVAWLLVFIRLMMPFWHLPANHPLIQSVLKITQPIIRPLRRWIPSYRHWDGATVFILFALALIKASLSTLLLYQSSFSFPALCLWAIADSADLLQDIYFWAILLVVFSSWVNPSPYHPAVQLLYSITNPIMAPIRRRLPSMGSLDFSPMLALVMLQILQILMINPLYYQALQWR